MSIDKSLSTSTFGVNQFRCVLLALTLFALFITIWRIGSQPPSGDDYGVALSAIQYVENGQLGPTMWNHPALRSILVYFSLKAFGPGAMGVKFWSVLFGILSVPLLAGVADKLFKNTAIAALAGFFMAIDPLRIDFSRQGINDIYLAFFPLAGIYLCLSYLDSRRAWSLIAAGIMFGCGLASKWSVAFQLIITIVYSIVVTLKEERLSPSDKRAEFLFVVSALVVVPLMLYIATFIPWFNRGYGLAEWLELQGQMLLETRTHAGYLKFAMELDHKAYEWFIRPVSNVSYILPPVDASSSEGYTLLASCGNPLVWLLTLPSFCHFIYRGVRQHDYRTYFAAMLFLLSYLPFVVAGRPIWVNSCLAVIPYAFLIVAHSIWTVCDKLRYRGLLLGGYVAVVALTSMPLYLMATGRGDDYSILRPVIERYLSVNRPPAVPLH